MHSMFRLTPFQSNTSRPNLIECLDRIIAHSGPKMRELVMERSTKENHQSSVELRQLQGLATRQPLFTGFLAKSTKLRLELGMYLVSETSEIRSDALATMLSHAYSLEHLFLELSGWALRLDGRKEWSKTQLCLDDHHYPRLRFGVGQLQNNGRWSTAFNAWLARAKGCCALSLSSVRVSVEQHVGHYQVLYATEESAYQHYLGTFFGTFQLSRVWASSRTLHWL